MNDWGSNTGKEYTVTGSQHWHFSEALKYKSVLVINKNFSINYHTPKPNAWWRLWQWVFFGFKWKDVK